ncbi:branched-chain-amino-acid aminotransferase, cytosolic-like isoform X1 [Liolophura sinensis]|uniref:branched-chain-amino-acid aminotransferase, cytosolic-like isoform X1 n=2 Tax=Liolophura sinensis TaxID=3198878 RepID=UPI00315909AC
MCILFVTFCLQFRLIAKSVKIRTKFIDTGPCGVIHARVLVLDLFTLLHKMAAKGLQIFRRSNCNGLLRSFSISLRFQSTAPVSSFRYDDLQVTLTSNPQPKPDSNKLVFGHHFTDHMLEIEWQKDKGWGRPVISPVHDLQLHPASKVLHYATELFEGMKAYRCVDNKVRLFRPMENMRRMQGTAKRTCLPAFDEEEMLKCLKKLVSIDQEWVPYSDSCSLYIRPTFIGTEPSLGVLMSNRALLYVLLGPVGPYFPTGMKPVTLLADPRHVRAWPGGSGQYKMGSNYAPTIAIQKEAIEQGCQQVLWLYGEDQQLTEVGTMNIMMYWINDEGENELITPPLSGIILPGVTRKSLLELTREWGEIKVTEKTFTMKTLIKALNENRVKELFGAGTACVVCPVEKILHEGKMLEIPTMSEGAPLTNRLYKALLDIQYGRVASPWMEDVDQPSSEGVEKIARKL